MNIVLYLFAGLCFINFTGKGSLNNECFYKDQSGQTICSTTEKYSSSDIIIENFVIIDPPGFIIFSSDYKILYFYNDSGFPTGRSPPFPGQPG